MAVKKKARGRSGGSSDNNNAYMALLSEKLETIKHANASELKELRIHMDKSVNRVFEKIDSNRERLVKLESEPLHVDFQRTYCPNTRELISVLGWIEQHKQDYKELKIYFDSKFKHLEETKRQQRNRFYTLLGAVAASAISALINLCGD